MKDAYFAFDLDGTITREEILPKISSELNLEKEMQLLTQLTLDGTIEFEASFRLRFHILRSVPVNIIHEIIDKVTLDPHIEKFITENKNRCSIITGNLDRWIIPIIEKLGCNTISSTSRFDTSLHLSNVLNKANAIRSLQKKNRKIIAIGESINDIPMFEEADVGIAFGGVHEPVKDLIQISDYITYEGKTLCTLLNTL